MKTETVTIEQKITPAELKKCFYIDLEVPENVESMTIAYDWAPRKDGNLDIGLIDSDGRQAGASGAAYREVTVSEKFATPGYRRQTPKAGKWKIIAGVDRVGTGVTAKYTVTFTFKERRWIRGDNHTHTVNSDGGLTPEQLIAKARKKGLDYIIITDHNNSIAAENSYNDPRVLVIKGTELTTFKGHINFWGINPQYDTPYCVNSFEDFLKIHKRWTDMGATVSINHPDDKSCGWRMPREGFHYDCVEVWNSPQRIDNMSAIRWWHNELLKGRRLAAVGGSDYHRDYAVTDLLAIPTTYVCTQSCTVDDILAALRRGNAFITSGVNGPKLYLTCGDAIPGDAVSFDGTQRVKIYATRLKKSDRLVLWCNDKIIYEHKAKSAENHLAEIAVPEKGFVRAEILTQYKGLKKAVYQKAVGIIFPPDAGLPIPPFAKALTNPIYFE